MAHNALNDVLHPDRIKPRLSSDDKDGIIREMIQILADAHAINDVAAAEQVVFEREKTMSTGMENGIAIPHGKTDTVDCLVVSLGLKPEGVEFECADGQPAQIIVLTLSPASRTGPHIRFMAGISKLLRTKDVRTRLLQCETADEILDVLNRA